MPYANHLPKMCRHRASDKAYVTLDGRQIYLGPWNSALARDAYKRLLGEWLVAGRILPPAPASNNASDCGGPTVVEVIAGYLRYCQGYYRGADGELADEVENIAYALKPVKELYGDLSAAQLSPVRLESIRKRMIDMDWSRGYINHSVGRIRRCLKWAASRELIPLSVYQATQTVDGLRYGRSGARETNPVKPVAQCDLDRTLPYLGQHVRAMVQVQLLCGARPGEICSMRTSEIDMSRPVWEYRPAKHKTLAQGHTRIIYLGPKAQEILLPFLKADPKAFIFSPRLNDEDRRQRQHAARKTPMSCGNVPGSNKCKKPQCAPGECYDTKGYAQAVRYGIIAANKARAQELNVPVEKLPEAERVSSWSPHRLRHNSATLLRKEFGVDVSRTVLGHTSLDATEIYAEPAREKAIEAMRKIG